jgi:hypothetical protein
MSSEIVIILTGIPPEQLQKYSDDLTKCHWKDNIAVTVAVTFILTLNLSFWLNDTFRTVATQT